MSEAIRDPRDPLVDNSSDAEQVRFARRTMRDVEKKRLEILRRLMHTDDGVVLFIEQLNAAGVFRMSFEPGVDLHTVAFREGGRNEGLRLLSDLFSADAVRAAFIFTEAITLHAKTATP